MRVGFHLSVLLAVGLFDSVWGNCSNEMCIPDGIPCSKLFKGNKNVESITKRKSCTFKQGANSFPGKYKGVCCATQEDADTFVAKKALGNLARTISGAEPNEYPHQVRFITKGMCGGTVYNKNWIITAAHCVRHDNNVFSENNGKFTTKWGEQKAYVIAGQSHVTNATEDDKYYIDKIILHEDWKPKEIGKGHDIALLHLARPLQLAKGKIQPMRLEPADYVPHYGGTGIVIGYGNVHEKLGPGSDDLMETEAPIHSPAKAARLSLEPEGGSGNRGTIHLKQHLAIGGEDSGVVVGQGDSGGPFICADDHNKPILCGIASYKTCLPYKMCRRPSYYVRVAPFLTWIKKNTGGEKQETNLLFDTPMFPEKIVDEDAPPYLLRVTLLKQSCAGVLLTPKLVSITGECIEANGGTAKIGSALIYHHQTGTQLMPTGAAVMEGFERDISPNITQYLKRHVNKNDLAFIILAEPFEVTQYAKLPPRGYEVKGRAVEYAFNDKTNSLERRTFVQMDEEDCLKKLNTVDKNLDLGSDKLCMKQVYSARAECDRDVGAPLMCENGKYFCGAKSFHGCSFSAFPELFNNNDDSNIRRTIDAYAKQYK
ncbi:unnamed protein product [Orchesella dallaii]|uniref:Peptidase S1 domain-containing protein n=1 Tax=Orchesella dallaii TaxID=48710 RepID=A0ABP1Q323_9HEXA